jgi:hypothetical protein
LHDFRNEIVACAIPQGEAIEVTKPKFKELSALNVILETTKGLQFVVELLLNGAVSQVWRSASFG